MCMKQRHFVHSTSADQSFKVQLQPLVKQIVIYLTCARYTEEIEEPSLHSAEWPIPRYPPLLQLTSIVQLTLRKFKSWVWRRWQAQITSRGKVSNSTLHIQGLNLAVPSIPLLVISFLSILFISFFLFVLLLTVSAHIIFIYPWHTCAVNITILDSWSCCLSVCL